MLILGGGCGGVAAAHALTASEARRAAFDVTLVSQGWRIGGKGASGRNQSDHDRIEEHGLHLFLGFYRKAFGILRDAYASLDGPADGVFASVAEAFTPQHEVTLWASPNDGGAGRWKHYTLRAPEWPGMPWDADPADLERAPARLASLLRVGARQADAPHLAEPLARDRLDPADARESESLMRWFLSELKDMDWGLGLHVLRDLMEIGGAVLRGYFADIAPHGWNAWHRIDHLDFRRWLISHGAREQAAWSEMIRVLYDLAFAYRGGDADDVNDADIAAGACLKLVLDLVAGYRHAPMWRMNGGMGDVVFTPLVKCIGRNGGEIRLFRRITRIEFDDGGVLRVHMQVQARPAGARYDPFIRVDGRDCWPSAPLWDQLEPDTPRGRFENPWDHSHVGTEMLERGRDFDHVILAIPPAASAELTEDLTARSPLWSDMLEHVGRFSVATHSVQLWVDRATGWLESDTVSGAYAPSLGTWADMTHLLTHESWPEGETRGCHYLVSVIELPCDLPPFTVGAPEVVAAADAQGCAVTDAWLHDNAWRMWPDLCSNTVFDPARVVSRHDHVNIAPSERYVRTPPGSIAHRLPPDWDGVPNMSLAGDWTITSINGGSAEAAMESGLTAADALARRHGVA
ncbi:FAD-dependent oxidoreductase [Roseobacter sp. HKCCA0434]|uniref:FAD-dependent oxidoreductase n=1 Tax=Roseobacter sp. HKCCA0434 TaxID=3079297 RepID=UPI002905C832|nr:FAD-dependent oxidoreductase [Roseobacter sp. HKCCA0434]